MRAKHRGPGLFAISNLPHMRARSTIAWVESKGYSASDALFPTESGSFPSKSTIIATIEAAARLLQLPLVAASGVRLWGGHALRRGGAQYLARSGVEAWRI
jgi:hypothetical protein